MDIGEVRTNLMKRRMPAEKGREKALFPSDPDSPVQLGMNPFQKVAQKCLLCDLVSVKNIFSFRF